MQPRIQPGIQPGHQSLIHYRIDLRPTSRELRIELTVDDLDPGSPVELAVPTWVPGAYGFMRYGRDIFDVVAEDAETRAPKSVTRAGWSGFRVEPGARRLVVRFRAKCADPAWGELAGYVDGTWAVLLATRCLFPPTRAGEKVRVTYAVPRDYRLHHPSGAMRVDERTWEYPSFRVWLDTPVVAFRDGVTVLSRTVEGTPFHFVFLGKAFGFASKVDGFLDDLGSVIASCRAVFGSFPFEDYTFVFAFDPRFHWGLEHGSATMIGVGDHVFIDDEERLSALRVSVHELVHAWNVCRLRPRGLGSAPGELDLVGGSFTEGLWVSEGFTRYYEFLLCVRAGKMNARRFFSNVVRYHRALSERPAHARTSVADSSLATFLNHHRYAGAQSTMVDYYDHGMLVAFDLDCALRAAGSSLDAEFRAFYERFVERPLGFSTDEAVAFFGKAEELLRREVQGHGPLSTLSQLERCGFELGFADEPVLGWVLKDNRGPEVVDVIEGGAAEEAGIAPGDVITQIDSLAFSPKGLAFATREGDVAITVRRGSEHRTARLCPRPMRRLTSLTWRGTSAQRSALEAWLGPSDLGAGEAIPLSFYDNFHGTEGMS